MGKALYRKYRPTKLDDVIGQPQIVEPLTAALKKNNISHAYLFIGPRGTGKTSIARIFAHAVNHFDYQLEDDYVDIIEIDAASNTGVDNIRELREKAIIAPTKGQYKIYIIDEIHMLSKSAFNALLKILEEPPKHIIFIMATTNPEKIPVTITSRAQSYQFSLAPPDVMKSHLQHIAKQEKIPIASDALDLIVKKGGGSFRDSISLLDQISNLATDSTTEITVEAVQKAFGLPKDQLINDLLTAYQSQSVVEITTLLKTILNTGTTPEALAEAIITQIIDNPQKPLLPLLAKLPNVQAPFGEAKLLLAFLDFSIAAPQPAAQSPAPRSLPHRPAPATQSPAQPTQNPAPATQNPAQPAQSPTPAAQSPAPAAPTNFSWENFLTAVQSSSTLLYNILLKSQHTQTGTTLHLYIKNTTIINATNNKTLLTRLSGLQIVAHELSEYNSPNYGPISDIMGNVEEITDQNGNPFGQ